MPSVTHVFRKDQEMFGYLEAYQPAAEKTAPMIATVKLLPGGAEGVRNGSAPDSGRAERKVERRAGDVPVPTRDAGAGTIHLPGQRGGTAGKEVRGLAVAGSASALTANISPVSLKRGYRMYRTGKLRGARGSKLNGGLNA